MTITAIGVDIDGQKIDLPARSVRKRFKPGDHVKVMAGQNADETGLVVAVSDNVALCDIDGVVDMAAVVTDGHGADMSFH